uniref:Aminoacyl tRNA synthase complex-interacting multifunctional protein 1 (Trinotate prediction) n=1 Tax=Henneguya salminicola TaxID=69463 RepID=A0A6G3MGY1_HENSL
MEIEKHPCADSLYVEKVDVGFEKYITVCSGLVNKISIEELDQKLAVFCCNLKPVKMRGIMSEGMIMCASDDNRVELLKPPPESNIGDRVTCPEFNCDPDLILNPKEKIWENVQPQLRVNEEGIAVYREKPLVVSAFGKIRSSTLKSCKIS